MKIKSNAKIKDAKITSDCGQLNFQGLKFSSKQWSQISLWIEGGEDLCVTMEPVQEKVSFKDEGYQEAREDQS